MGFVSRMVYKGNPPTQEEVIFPRNSYMLVRGAPPVRSAPICSSRITPMSGYCSICKTSRNIKKYTLPSMDALRLLSVFQGLETRALSVQVLTKVARPDVILRGVEEKCNNTTCFNMIGWQAYAR